MQIDAFCHMFMLLQWWAWMYAFSSISMRPECRIQRKPLKQLSTEIDSKCSVICVDLWQAHCANGIVFLHLFRRINRRFGPKYSQQAKEKKEIHLLIVLFQLSVVVVDIVCNENLLSYLLSVCMYVTPYWNRNYKFIIIIYWSKQRTKKKINTNEKANSVTGRRRICLTLSEIFKSPSL